MRIALSRLGSPVRNREEAIERLAHAYHQSVADAVDLVVFPEVVMLEETVDVAACSDLLLMPSDLKRLAALVGSVPLLIGGSIEGQPSAAKAAVYALSGGAIEQLQFQPNGSQWLISPGQMIETMMLRNSWLVPEQIHEYHRPHFLNGFNTTVALDFYSQICVREALPHLPLQVYWHLVEPGGDCVCANGIICGHSASRNLDHNLVGDAHVTVDLDSLWPERQNHFPKGKPVGSNLILGCATRLPIRVGVVELVVEVQRSWRQFKGGMMFREQLTDAEGMLFVYSRPKRASFYMANTKSPLSCAYIDSAGIIREIHDMEPFNRNSIRASSDNIQFVLETKQGWFARHDVPIGSAVLITNRTPGKLFFGT